MQSRYTRDRGNMYLRFQFKGTKYKFQCLPFGLFLALRVFTRTVLRSIPVKLRSEGIRTVIFLDDLLLIRHQKDTLSEIFLYVQRQPRFHSEREMLLGTNSSLSVSGYGARHNLHVSLSCQRNRSIGYRPEHARKW